MVRLVLNYAVVVCTAVRCDHLYALGYTVLTCVWPGSNSRSVASCNALDVRLATKNEDQLQETHCTRTQTTLETETDTAEVKTAQHEPDHLSLSSATLISRDSAKTQLYPLSFKPTPIQDNRQGAEAVSSHLRKLPERGKTEASKQVTPSVCRLHGRGWPPLRVGPCTWTVVLYPISISNLGASRRCHRLVESRAGVDSRRE